ncbi:hypothetical protein DFH94DRAFT_688868 [Russula ochroleuca]|uniref:DRBM domain-containing protein n=1 Tax=Russula ochroleuca TaxID=152965 RepID=A0A9P5TCE0_9AGAM|nr:hypothetical protein DFH94DRAFT_688868 [Russula ochroleuca]
MDRTREQGRLRLGKCRCSWVFIRLVNLLVVPTPLDHYKLFNHNNNSDDDDDMPGPDYPVLLNNLLQRHATGNLAGQFRYVMSTDGPEDNITHIATANFRGVTYAVGSGKSKGAAKAAAAQVVYEDFSRNGVPEA